MLRGLPPLLHSRESSAGPLPGCGSADGQLRVTWSGQACPGQALLAQHPSHSLTHTLTRTPGCRREKEEAGRAQAQAELDAKRALGSVGGYHKASQVGWDARACACACACTCASACAGVRLRLCLCLDAVLHPGAERAAPGQCKHSLNPSSLRPLPPCRRRSGCGAWLRRTALRRWLSGTMRWPPRRLRSGSARRCGGACESLGAGR